MSDSDQHAAWQRLQQAKDKFAQGDYSSAEAEMRYLLDGLSEQPEALSDCIECLTEIYNSWGKYNEAIQLNEQLIRHIAPLGGNQAERVGASLERIAFISDRMGQNDQAQGLMRQAMEIRTGRLNPIAVVQRMITPSAPPPRQPQQYSGGPSAPGAASPSQPASYEKSQSGQGPSQSFSAKALVNFGRGGGQPNRGPASQQYYEPEEYSAPPPQAPPQQKKPAQNRPPQNLPPKPEPPAPWPTPQIEPAAPPAQPVREAPSPYKPQLQDIAAAYSPPPLPPAPGFGEAPPPFPHHPAGQQFSEEDYYEDSQLHPTDDYFDETEPGGQGEWKWVEQPAGPGAPASSGDLPPPIPGQDQPPPFPSQPGQIDDQPPPIPSQSGQLGEQTPPFPGQQGQLANQFNPASPGQVSPAQPQAPGSYSPRAQSGPAQAKPGAKAAPGQAAGINIEPPPQPSAPKGPTLQEQMEQQAFARPSAPPPPPPPKESNQSPSSRGAQASTNTLRSKAAGDNQKPPGVSPLDKMKDVLQGLIRPQSGADVQEVVDETQGSQRSVLILAAVAFAIFCIGFLAYKFLPRALTPEQAYGTIHHQWRSADSSTLLWLKNSSDCEFTVGKDRINTSYHFYLSDWRDALDMALSSLFQKQYWLYQSGESMSDDEGRTIYPSNGAEAKLVDKLEIIGQYAAMCYAKKNRYPDLPTRMKASFNLEYENPFTTEKELPSFQTLTVGEGKSEAADDQARNDLFIDLFSGGSWKDAPEPHPGQIRCLAVDFHNVRGNTQAFIVQIIGADKKPLRGSIGGNRFFYALENGRPYKVPPSEKPQLPFKGQTGIKPIVLWLFDSKPDAGLIFMLKNGGIILFSTLAVIFLVVGFSMKASKRGVFLILFGITAIAALAYTVARALP